MHHHGIIACDDYNLLLDSPLDSRACYRGFCPDCGWTSDSVFFHYADAIDDCDQHLVSEAEAM